MALLLASGVLGEPGAAEIVCFVPSLDARNVLNGAKKHLVQEQPKICCISHPLTPPAASKALG